MVRYFYLFVVVLILGSSCADKFSLLREDNNSASLRLDGIYLSEDSLQIVDMYFFYENGIVLSRGSIQKDKLESKIHNLAISQDEKYKSMKFLWGVYHIEDDRIKFERWYPSDTPYEAYIKEGKILNDTTFQIDKSYRTNGKVRRNINEKYQFRKTSSKPDSLNRWIFDN